MQTAQILTVHTNVNALKVTEEMDRIVQVNIRTTFVLLKGASDKIWAQGKVNMGNVKCEVSVQT
jgi:hypothetical protein